MTVKSYNQACSLAIALDIVGERWTWLVIRALLTGPKRFGEIADQLPGIGSNLLAKRLKSLSDRGVVEREGTGRQSAYRLTDLGEGLRPIAHALIRWGRAFRASDGSLNPGERVTSAEDHTASPPASMPEWDVLAIESAFRPELAEGAQAVLQLTLSGFTFHLVIRNQVCRAVAGPAVAPDATIESDSDTLMAISARLTSVRSAEQKVRLKISGDRTAANLLFTAFR
jgi:DNA-binding HxlR family transcriptional regulator/putative sterol carrier protein